MNPNKIDKNCGVGVVTCTMLWRFFIAVLAMGLTFQGCTLQKRSLMPGWHVDWSGQAPTPSGTPCPEPGTDFLTGASEQLVVVAPSSRDPLIPLKALEASSPSVEIASEIKMPGCLRRENVHHRPTSDGVDPRAEVATSPQSSNQDRRVAWRIFMGFIAIILVIASVPAFSLGFFDLSLAPFILLGIGLLFLSWRALLFAFPKLRDAFPKLRARFSASNNRHVDRRAKREEHKASHPNQDWLWLLVLAPLALLALVLGTFSFPMFGM